MIKYGSHQHTCKKSSQIPWKYNRIKSDNRKPKSQTKEYQSTDTVILRTPTNIRHSVVWLFRVGVKCFDVLPHKRSSVKSPIVQQELLSLPEHLNSSQVLQGPCYSSFSFHISVVCSMSLVSFCWTWSCLSYDLMISVCPFGMFEFLLKCSSGLWSSNMIYT